MPEIQIIVKVLWNFIFEIMRNRNANDMANRTFNCYINAFNFYKKRTIIYFLKGISRLITRRILDRYEERGSI